MNVVELMIHIVFLFINFIGILYYIGDESYAHWFGGEMIGKFMIIISLLTTLTVKLGSIFLNYLMSLDFEESDVSFSGF